MRINYIIYKTRRRSQSSKDIQSLVFIEEVNESRGNKTDSEVYFLRKSNVIKQIEYKLSNDKSSESHKAPVDAGGQFLLAKRDFFA